MFLLNKLIVSNGGTSGCSGKSQQSKVVPHSLWMQSSATSYSKETEPLCTIHSTYVINYQSCTLHIILQLIIRVFPIGQIHNVAHTHRVIHAQGRDKLGVQ